MPDRFRSYVALMSPNEDETGLALLIISHESNSSSYINVYMLFLIRMKWFNFIKSYFCHY